jgi:hypothetical protein
MSKTIEGVPEFITEDQYLALFEACGFTPAHVFEMRMAHDGVHALVGARHPDHGGLIVDPHSEPPGYHKHRVFIPVRRADDDRRRTRIREVRD